LLLRYSNPDNYYVLRLGCPSDYVQLLRMYEGKLDQLQQKVVAIDPGNWYKVKVEAQADHFIVSDDGKMVFDVQDNKIAKGRIGLESSNDSQARFDNFTLTLPLPGASSGGDSGAGAGTPPPPPPPL
jgi:hypothetical protein